jgi:hypothetical protein
LSLEEYETLENCDIERLIKGVDENGTIEKKAA